MTYREVLLFVMISLLTVTDGLSQVVKVTDHKSREPIENVYIYNARHNQTALTNLKGEADLSDFSKDDTLFFQHPSYHQYVAGYVELQKNDFKARLKERKLEMNEIFVSASKRKQDRSKIPRRIESISEQEINFYSPQTSADLLESRAKVFVQKSQLGGGSPMLRGFAANSVLLAMDGMRINNAIFRSGNLQNVINIDPNVVQNSEIIYGPGSIIYGSDALGGVMNFETKDPELSYNEELLTGGNVMTRYSSANQEHTLHGDVMFGGKKWGSFTSITYSRFGNLRTGGNFDEEYDWGKRPYYVERDEGEDRVVPNRNVTHQVPSGFKQLHVMQKIRYKPTSKLDMTYSGYLSTTSDIPRYDRLIQWDQGWYEGEPVNAEWYYGPQQWMLHSLEAKYSDVAINLFDQVSFTGGYQNYEESRNDREFQNDTLRNRTEKVEVVTANIDFDKRWGEKTSLYYGIEGVYNYVESEAHKRDIMTGQTAPTGTRYPDGGSDYIQLAAYAKFNHSLSESWDLILGTRYSHVMLSSDFVEGPNDLTFYDFPFETIELNTGALNGSAGLTYHPNDRFQFSFNASSGFRAPNVDDVAKVFDSEPGNVVVPNENVGPEYTYNLDAGIIKKIGYTFRFQVDGYYTWLRDAMVRRKASFNGQEHIMYDGTRSRVEKVVNAGKAFLYGGSASISADFRKHFSFYTQLTYTEGEEVIEDSANIPLRHVPPLFGQTGLRYQYNRLQTEVNLRYNADKPLSDFSPSERNKPHMYTDEGTPGWMTLNINAQYRLTSHFQLTIGADNLFDTHYRPYSSGISAPGRHVDLTLNATF